MTDLTSKEVKRLDKINQMLGWRFPNSISKHFNDTSRGTDFIKAPTAEEKLQQKKLLPAIMSFNDAKSAIASAQNSDIFLTAARRVGTDDELANLLPPGFEKTDIALLEKCKLSALAALVKNKLA